MDDPEFILDKAKETGLIPAQDISILGSNESDSLSTISAERENKIEVGCAWTAQTSSPGVLDFEMEKNCRKLKLSGCSVLIQGSI